ncbi:MAG: hypothetical protein U5K72_04940 [Balneolaceae bacterium]|nr:hypothetical protein [Balneolaceae bacterium]MDZ7717345.1 hypothetical protein [Balneolaceae bacterium]MDZ7718149.1 hypothetical protein [Balneolaceae bacterium]
MRSNYLRILTITIFLLTLIVTSCKDSTSSESSFIEITDSSYSVVQLNGCDIDSGASATRFQFVLNFDSSSGVDISGIEFDILFESGTEGENIFEDDFEVVGQSLEFDFCFRFGSSSSWIEIYPSILANNEELVSNEITIRIERPEDANKNS